jgi:hypothetical protein
VLLLVVLASARGSFRAVCLPSGNWGSSHPCGNIAKCGENNIQQKNWKILISEKSEKIFFNGFPISSPAFRFLKNPGKSIYGGKYTKDRYPSFVFPLLTM